MVDNSTCWYSVTAILRAHFTENKGQALCCDMPRMGQAWSQVQEFVSSNKGQALYCYMPQWDNPKANSKDLCLQITAAQTHWTASDFWVCNLCNSCLFLERPVDYSHWWTCKHRANINWNYTSTATHYTAGQLINLTYTYHGLTREMIHATKCQLTQASMVHLHLILKLPPQKKIPN